MKPSNGSIRDDGDEESGEPARERAPAEPWPDVRGSGVRVRGARPPLPQGPCTSFKEVHTRYKRVVWLRIIERLRHDPSGAEDVHQEAFIHLDRRIRALGSVPDPVWPVLAGLIEDAVRNHKRTVRRRRIDGEPGEDMPSSKPNPEQVLTGAADRASLRQDTEAIFALMAATDVELIKLAHVGELSMKDVGDIVGKTEGAATVALHRARARFKALHDERRQASGRKP